MATRDRRDNTPNRQFAAYSLETDKSNRKPLALSTDTSSIGSSDSTEMQLPVQLPPHEQLPPVPAIGIRVRNIPARFKTDVWAESLRNYKSKSKQSGSVVKAAASSSSSSSQETRLPKNKITVGYATNDALYKDIIGMLLAGMSISAITTVLCNANNKYREILTQNARPDNECTIARGADPNGPLKDYKNAPERNNGTGAYDVDNSTKNLINNVPAVNGLKRPFYLALVLDKTKGKKRMTSVPFTPSHMGDCGNCWLCNLPVHYYWQNEKGYINTTGCGDCEHVGAIVAAFLAGMLSNQGNPDQFKYNYHPSHPHCNKWKSNTIPMKFDKTKGEWVHDTKGIATIAKDIATSPIHGSEYCPKFITAYNEKKITVEKIKTYINGPATAWCNAANESLARNTDKTKTNIASALASIIAKTAPKLISTTTVNSVKKVKMQRKQSGGCGDGDNIFVEEIPGEDAVNIYDTNTFYELQRTTDDDELDSLQMEYNAIFDESADENTTNMVFECLFNVFDAIEDPYEIGSGVTGILNVLSRYLYGLDQDIVKNQELIDDINSRIRTITDNFGDELNETDYEVLDINNDAPAKVVYSAIVSPEKKNDGNTRKKPLDNASDLTRHMLSDNENDNEVSAANYQLTPGTSENEDTGTEDDNEVSAANYQLTPGTSENEDTGTEDDDEVAAADRAMTPGTKRNNTALHEAQNKQARTPSNQTPRKTPIVGSEDGTQDQDNYPSQSEEYGEANKTFTSISDTAPRLVPGGKRLNKRQSKQKSQKRNQKNKTKRISYIKNKQTRKNKHSKKTKSKRSNKK
jgi:hypothetical protein